MTTHTTHPLAAAYLRDLGLLLHGLPPGEREEVLAGVREHLDATTTPTSDDTDVRAVLAELGPPQAVADEAYAGAPPRGVPHPTSRPVMARTWVPVVVGALLGLSLLLSVLTSAAVLAYGVASDSTGRTQVDFLYPHPAEVAGFLVLSSPMWIAALALLLATPLWRPKEKWLLVALLPVATSLAPVLASVGWALTHAELGINLGAWIGLGGVAASAVLLVVLCRRAASRVA